MSFPFLRVFFILAATLTLSACGNAPSATTQRDGTYGILEDGDYTLPAIPAKHTRAPNRRATVSYEATDQPGSIIVDPHAKFLFFVTEPGQAVRYPIAVGREGRGFRGYANVGEKRAWPSWTPTANMLRREPHVYGPFARGIPGGIASPLGARALYLYRGGRDTRYRIHGTNDLNSIGNSGSAGCIRLFNHDIIDLFNRVGRGASVRVRSYEESVQFEGAEMANRGVELPPLILSAEEVYGAVAADQARLREEQGG